MESTTEMVEATDTRRQAATVPSTGESYETNQPQDPVLPTPLLVVPAPNTEEDPRCEASAQMEETTAVVPVAAGQEQANVGGEILGNTRSAILRRRGKRGRNGPDYRQAPNEETAMAKAIRTTQDRPGEPIFYPYKGTVFNSREEGKEFYNFYSWEKGFGVRFYNGRKNDEQYKTKTDIVCSCQGRPCNPNSSSARTNCKAKIRLLRRGDHSWYVSEINDTHNHKLTESYEENQQWGSHGYIDPCTKDFIKKLRENNVSLGRVCNILGLSNDKTMTGIRRESVHALCAKLSQENLRDDIGKTVKLLEDMKKQDPGFEVRFRVYSQGVIDSMLWCTGKNRADYAKYGDAITFDTTYRTNLYSLPFGIFIGINNHFQSIIFGGVLLTSEKTTDFEWAFTTFVELMGGKAPKTILTDQCAAMTKAIKNKLKQTKHRWCRWHVLKEAKTYLGFAYSKHSTFKKEFNELVTFERDPRKFEAKWKALQTKFKLTKNTYLNRLFRHREKWAKPYFMDIFCGGMTSTQRSESANHMLKALIQKAAPMHLFVSKFRELQIDRKYQEGKESFVTYQRNRKLRTSEPLAEHANAVYTRAMYERFDWEIYRSGKFRIYERKSPTEFILIHNKMKDVEQAYKFHARLHYDEYIECTCGLYEHMGMICRHAIKVLVHLDKQEIPKRNILGRWTKAWDGENTDKQHPGVEIWTEADKRTMLINKAIELGNRARRLTNYEFEQAMQVLTTIEQGTQGHPSNNDTAGTRIVFSTDQIPTPCPPSAFKGGRPPNTGMKSWNASIKKQTNGSAVQASEQVTDWPYEENPPTKKKRFISEIGRK